MSYRIGIDVGGTNTDAVILDEDLRVVAAVKTPTSAGGGSGVEAAIAAVIERSGIDPRLVHFAMLGTTHCTNAIVERRNLGRVGIIRLGLPATTAVPPLEGWPEELRASIEPRIFVLDGGFEVDGRTIRPVNEEQVRQACTRMRGLVDAVAVVGVFSPMDRSQEDRVAEIVASELGVPVSRSADIGSIGLLERENATVLNAALIRTLGGMVEGFRAALVHHGITAPVYLGQNDGTLMTLEYALSYPVFTIGCGPTNSIRGAAHLSGLKDAIVVDIGGTTTDIGLLVNGFPRQSSQAAEIGGIRTNFRMPDVLSVALGGGTMVHGPAGAVRLGPQSVGYRIGTDALVFGGSTLTVTDIAAAAGRFNAANAQDVELDAELLSNAETAIRALLEDSVDRMKSNSTAVPAILVGGGSIVAPESLAGISELVRPEFFGAANAVGSALGDVSGSFERIYPLSTVPRDQALRDAREQATARAIAAGALPESVELLEIEEIPLAYLAEASVLIRAKAAGPLARTRVLQP
ncbi:hydantoinase/oxoprolinase N-terminal domain-containing protein [Paeniglutamicibacter sp. NPDC091659]|uniref:hydantoinase/oxoprolinase N-terminal domain-containing protein n=1 Tax=Paeniglutamicibacter sp. NPDC091659 TaxID=3364389 RepID=UPI003826D183